MSEVFDEELMKELGLEPDEIAPPSPDKTKTAQKKQEPVSPQKTPAKAPINQESPASHSDVLPPMQNTPSLRAQAPIKTEPDSFESQALRMSQEIPVQLVAVLAKKSIGLKEVLELKSGELIDFKRLPQEPVDLVANGKLIAKADLVLIDGKVGARIVKLVK